VLALGLRERHEHALELVDDRDRFAFSSTASS